MSLQEKTKRFLEDNGIKKSHLASLLGIYPTQLYKWFLGKYRLNDTQTEKVEHFISVNHS